MRAFEVHLNGTKLCLAGVDSHGVLSAIVNSISGAQGASLFLHVGGLVSDTHEHLNWVSQKPLSIGDEIRVRLVDTLSVDEPTNRRQPESAIESQKTLVRTLAKKLGWTIQEDPTNRP